MSADTRLLGLDTPAPSPRRMTRWTARRSAALLILACGVFWLGVVHLIRIAQG